MFIEFGILNYRLLIPLIYPILFQIRRFIHEDTNIFYELLTDFFGYMCGGVIFLIIKYRMKNLSSTKTEIMDKKTDEIEEKEKEKDKSNEKITRTDSVIAFKMHTNSIVNNNTTFNITKSKAIYSNINVENIYRQIEKKEMNKYNIKYKYLSLLGLSLIYIIPLGLEAFTLSDININFKAGSSLFYYIFFYVLFSRIILGVKISNHHLLSIIIIIACMPIMLTLFIFNEKEKDYFKLFLHSLYFILITALFSIYNTLEKKYFNKFMDSIYHLMFVVGCICATILMIYELITISIFGIKETTYNGIIFQILKNIKEYSYLYILYFILDVFTAFIWLLGIQLIIYFLSPCHIIIAESLSQIITTILKNSISKYHIAAKIIIYIIYTIIIFSSLIYNEVIIINIYSLSKDTKKKIILRELTEKNIQLTTGEIMEDLEEN